MTLAERFIGRSFFERRRTVAQAQGEGLSSLGGLHASPASEGDSWTGIGDITSEKAPLTIKIIGDRDLTTGEIRPYHEEIHGTTRILPINQEQNIT